MRARGSSWNALAGSFAGWCIVLNAMAPVARGQTPTARATPPAAPVAAPHGAKDVATAGRSAVGGGVDHGLRAELERATADYAQAFNARDLDALAEQWTTGALLVEGGGRLVGRDAIVQSIGAWLQRAPEAKLEMTLGGVLPLGPSVAKVRGTMRFLAKPGARPVESHFESLRVREDATWRLAESVVLPSQDVAMEQLDWLLGAWTATDPTDGAVLESRYERAADGHVIIGRTTITPKDGPALEAVDVIHADAGSGTVRSWLFDSSGARAEGVFETDGTVFNRVYRGIAAPGGVGSRTAWVQLVVPTDRDTLVLQAVERTLDDRPMPDGRPWHLKRKP